MVEPWSVSTTYYFRKTNHTRAPAKLKMTTMASSPTTPFPLLPCNNHLQLPPKFLSSLSNHHHLQLKSLSISPKFRNQLTIPCSATRKPSNNPNKNSQFIAEEDEDEDESFRPKLTQAMLWGLEGVYILWLFLLPYAPGDLVWAMSSDTINSLVGLFLNFFFILPISNSVGIHAMEAPVLHPMSEGLSNFVLGWTFMFAPLLYTDFKNGRFKGSLDVLWGLQMFLTNTFMIAYMAIRLNEADASDIPRKKTSQLGNVMVKGAPIVGLVGGIVYAVSIPWAFFGRMDGDFGSLSDRWSWLLRYVGSERLAYAFICDTVLYTFFQPWLIGENLENVAENKIELVSYARYIPVVGLIAYLLCMNKDGVVEQLE